MKTITHQKATATYWFYKAASLWQNGKWTDPKKAIEYLNKAIRLEPDHADAYYNRGIVYENLGQRQRASEDVREALRLKPDLALAYYDQGEHV